MKINYRYSLVTYARSAYQDPLKRLLLRKMYSDIATTHRLADFMANYELFNYNIFDYVIPIPSHWTRYAYRGFNQSYEYAKAIAQSQGIVLLPVLKRIKQTSYQSRLNIGQRVENVQNAFELDEKMRQHVVGKRILLVDDLMTSGATLISATRILCTAKPASVTAYVLCRVIK